jgi:hypothetical protein
MGAIDDTASTRLADVKTAHNYVAAALDAITAGQPIAAALDAITAGQPIAVASTRTYGRSVKYKEE